MTNPVIGFENVSAGFRDRVADAQTVFRCILDATAHPGRIVEIPADLLAPNDAGLSHAAAAFALTLLDFETPVWLDSDISTAGDFLRFHCGAPLVAAPNESRLPDGSRRVPALTEME